MLHCCFRCIKCKHLTNSNRKHHQVCFNSCFPGDPGLASSVSVFFIHLLQTRTFGDNWRRFFVVQKQEMEKTNKNDALTVDVKDKCLYDLVICFLCWLDFVC